MVTTRDALLEDCQRLQKDYDLDLTWPLMMGGRPRRQYDFVRRCCVRSAILIIR